MQPLLQQVVQAVMHNKVDTLPPSGTARMFRGLRGKIYLENFAEWNPEPCRILNMNQSNTCVPGFTQHNVAGNNL